jgi:hypothetical protein
MASRDFRDYVATLEKLNYYEVLIEAGIRG